MCPEMGGGALGWIVDVAGGSYFVMHVSLSNCKSLSHIPEHCCRVAGEQMKVGDSNGLSHFLIQRARPVPIQS